MITEIPNILAPEQLERVQSLFDDAPKQDGKVTMGAYVQHKNNQEAAPSDQLDEMTAIVQRALQADTGFNRSSWPSEGTVPIFSEYREGMGYHNHFDNPLTEYTTQANELFPKRFRSDISATLFLNAPSEYDGGELVIQTPAGISHIKAAAGTLVTYPSGYMHRVDEVTKGVRRVAVIWFQSYFRNAEQRNLIVEMNTAVTGLLTRYPEDPAVEKTNYVLSQLVKMWGE